MSRPAARLALAILIAAAVGLAGCGRKGKLEPPPGEDYITQQNGKKIDPGPVKPKTSFPLDFLLN